MPRSKTRQYKKKSKTSDQDGSGVKEALEVGKAVLTGNISKILKKQPKAIKKLLTDHGDKKIVKVVISRKPITKTFQLIANQVTNARAVMKEHGYDALYHLFSNFYLDDGSIIGIDKQTRLTVRNGGFPVHPSDFIEKKVTGDWTFNKLFTEAEQKFGARRLYRYSTHTNNCQRYLADLMDIMGLLDSKTKGYIMQDIDGIITKGQSKFVQKLTDVANIGEYITQGGGKTAEKTKKKRPPSRWILHVQEYRKQHPELSYKQCLTKAKDTYTKSS
jgi:hypothetical protein